MTLEISHIPETHKGKLFIWALQSLFNANGRVKKMHFDAYTLSHKAFQFTLSWPAADGIFICNKWLNDAEFRNDSPIGEWG